MHVFHASWFWLRFITMHYLLGLFGPILRNKYPVFWGDLLKNQKSVLSYMLKSSMLRQQKVYGCHMKEISYLCERLNTERKLGQNHSPCGLLHSEKKRY